MVTTIARPAAQSEQQADRHYIFVSNRGPLEHYIDPAGQIAQRPSGGGVAVALSAAASSIKVSWIAGACNHADRLVSRTLERVQFGDQGELRLVPIPATVAEPFYNSFCNPILWFIQHNLGSQIRSRDIHEAARRSWLTGYVPANRRFAATVLDEIDRHGNRARVMLHDYHLYLVPRLIRRARPDVLLQQFIHIPWPEPTRWRALPDWMVREICRSLLANDSLAFQTDESAANFVSTCEAYLAGGASRTYALRSAGESRETHIWSNPISTDVDELASLSDSPEVAASRPLIGAEAGEMTIVRVDRLDPSKNVLRGFQALDLLLRRRPDLRGRLKFLAFLVPSREGIEEYEDYARAVFRLIKSINGRHGTQDWKPISVYYEQNRAQAIAGLELYDVLLVNSVADGMNLVSKEGPIVNRRNGVLCLSMTAGSFEQLGASAVGLDPLSVDDTARAIEQALDLRPEARSELASATNSAIQSHQLSDWLRHLMQDLELAAWKRGTRFATV